MHIYFLLIAALEALTSTIDVVFAIYYHLSLREAFVYAPALLRLTVIQGVVLLGFALIHARIAFRSYVGSIRRSASYLQLLVAMCGFLLLGYWLLARGAFRIEISQSATFDLVAFTPMLCWLLLHGALERRRTSPPRFEQEYQWGHSLDGFGVVNAVSVLVLFVAMGVHALYKVMSFFAFVFGGAFAHH